MEEKILSKIVSYKDQIIGILLFLLIVWIGLECIAPMMNEALA